LNESTAKTNFFHFFIFLGGCVAVIPALGSVLASKSCVSTTVLCATVEITVKEQANISFVLHLVTFIKILLVLKNQSLRL